jgi:hypothetical protein
MHVRGEPIVTVRLEVYIPIIQLEILVGIKLGVVPQLPLQIIYLTHLTVVVWYRIAISVI